LSAVSDSLFEYTVRLQLEWRRAQLITRGMACAAIQDVLGRQEHGTLSEHDLIKLASHFDVDPIILYMRLVKLDVVQMGKSQ
jgi:hypothetical protein